MWLRLIRGSRSAATVPATEDFSALPVMAALMPWFLPTRLRTTTKPSSIRVPQSHWGAVSPVVMSTPHPVVAVRHQSLLENMHESHHPAVSVTQDSRMQETLLIGRINSNGRAGNENIFLKTRQNLMYPFQSRVPSPLIQDRDSAFFFTKIRPKQY